MRITVDGSSAVAVTGPRGLGEQRQLADQRAGPDDDALAVVRRRQTANEPSWTT